MLSEYINNKYNNKELNNTKFWCDVTIMIPCFYLDPNSVTEEKVKSNTSSTITVQWKGSSNVPAEGSKYMKYLLSYKRVGDSTWRDSETVQHNSGQTYYEGIVSGLMSNTEYDIEIRARYVNGSEGKGEQKKKVRAKTKQQGK